MVLNKLCYLLAVEKLLNIKVPTCAQWIQVLFGEIMHILNCKPLAALASPQINLTQPKISHGHPHTCHGCWWSHLWGFKEKEKLMEFYKCVFIVSLHTAYISNMAK